MKIYKKEYQKCWKINQVCVLFNKVKKKTNLKASASELGAFANLSPVEQRKFPKLTI